MEFYIDHFGNDLSTICRPDDNQEEFLVEKEKELQKEKDKLRNYKEELFLLSNIVHEIIGLTPDIQRDLVGEHFKQYAEKDSFPNVRDVVKALMNISKKEWPSKT